MSENNTGAFLTGFLLGGLVGATAALLMTPQSGKNTRVQIQQRGIELKTQLDDLTSEIQERGKDIIETKHPGSGVMNDAEEFTDEEEQPES